MTDLLLSLLVTATAVSIAGLVQLVRSDRLPHGAVLAMTLVCGGGLLAMILTDWPLEDLAEFWADHAVLAGVISSLLLVGLVFLVYERGEQKRRGELAYGLSGAGVGGIVDSIIDIEVALGLLSADKEPSELEPMHWAKWDEPEKPLRWLREGRDEILNSLAEPRRDPRALIVAAESPLAPWGQELIDQAIRRLLAAMRDWAPLVGASEDGTAALLLMSRVRSDLMELRELYPETPEQEPTKEQIRRAASELVSLRTRLRILAFYFEAWSGAAKPRKGVLPNSLPLPPVSPDFVGVGRTLSKGLADTARELGFGQRRTTVVEVSDFARLVHAGQVDKLGRDYYIYHLLPVAAKLLEHGGEAEMAGLLHDVLEDTPVTAHQLREIGIPREVVRAVEAVTKREGEAYDDLIKRSAADPLGRLVKLADNELNLESNDALAAVDPDKAARLKFKYESARELLLQAGQ